MRTILLTCTAAAMALATEPAARLSSPILGYVFDSTAKGVRPINGIPGAASLEAPLPSASKLATGFVSPNREWLLAVLLEGGAAVVNLRSGATTVLESAQADTTLGAWSSDGSSVVLWGRSGSIQVWTGLPGAPTLALSQTLEAIKGVAVADKGESALAWSDSGLFLAEAGGLRQLTGEAVAGAAYRPGSLDWAAVTGTQLIGSGVEPRALTVETPSAVAFAGAGLLVAGKGGVEAIDAAGSATIVPCECAATSLDRLAGADVFRLTGVGAPAIAVYDGNNADLRILYIPSEGGRQ